MDGKIRIAIGGIWHETNTFSPAETGTEDFWIIRDSALLEYVPRELAGDERFEFLPAFLARAIPCGLVREKAYLGLKEELLREFKSMLPVDGVCLVLHGAMEIEEIGDGESDLTSAVRELVGPDALISASFDLHGNISQAVARQCDILTAFRTAPHRDEDETISKAISLLTHSLIKGIRPVSVLVKPPFVLSGEAAMTDFEPAKSLYERLDDIDMTPGILDSSLLVGCAYTDGPDTSTSVITVAESDAALARSKAEELAAELWSRRKEFRFGHETASVDDAIREAMICAERPIFISDSGDNITAGGAGDIPYVTARLLALGAEDALVAGVLDRDAVVRCAAAGVGADVTVTVGKNVDRNICEPLELTGIVRHLSPLPDGGGSLPAIATLQAGKIHVALTSKRVAFEDRASIAQTGIDPMKPKIVVVKLGYLYADLYDHAPRAIMALSPGTTPPGVENLPYRKISRPIFPLDTGLEWKP